MLNHRHDLKRIRKKADMEKELVHARHEASARLAQKVGTAETSPDEPANSVDNFNKNLEIAKGDPQCHHCNQLLARLANEPVDRRKQGVAELAQLKQMMKQDPTREQLKVKMREFEILPELTLQM